jgi:ABC-2 type transport system ATP-binding protein
MDEAERLCDRVAIIDRGKVIALGTPADLVARLGGEHIVELATDPAIPADRLADLAAVVGARAVLDGVALNVSEPHVALPALIARLGQLGAQLTRLSVRHATLEDVFVDLTGRQLRDE